MNKCERCEGGGKLADDGCGTPWTHWVALSSAVGGALIGMVNPIPCPACNGTGISISKEVGDEK